MGGRGAESGGGKGLSASKKQQITRGIQTHSKAENDRAEQNYENNISREKRIVENPQQYISTGYIKSTSDSWFQGHVNTYNELRKQLQYFKSERRRLGK